MAAAFEVYTDKRGEFRWRLKSGNGQIIATGEGYKERAGALNCIEAIKRDASGAAVHDLTGK